MKYNFPSSASSLGFGRGGAQVASHAPTVFAQPPAQDTAAQPRRQGKPVARVNGTVLTDADLVREEYAIFPYARQHNGIPKEMEPQIRDGAMKMIIFEELVYQEALRRKMTVSGRQAATGRGGVPQAVCHAGRVQRISAERFSRLRAGAAGEDPALAADRGAAEDRGRDKSAVSPAEVRAYYDKNPGPVRAPRDTIHSRRSPFFRRTRRPPTS